MPQMPEFAVYITDHSQYPDSDGFYIFEAGTVEDALQTAVGLAEEQARAWTAHSRVEFALPLEAARLAVDIHGAAEIRPASEVFPRGSVPRN